MTTHTSPYDARTDAAARLAEQTGVERHDVALVMGSGWLPAAEMLGDASPRSPPPTCPASRHRPSRVTPARSGRSTPAASARWSSSAAPTTTRASASPPSCTACGWPPPRAVARSCLTNGCGGLRPEWAPGTPVLIQDHINLTATSPIVGRELRRPHRPLLASAARAVPRGRAGPRRGRLRPVARAALRDAGRDRDGPHGSAATWSACRRPSRRSPPARQGMEILGLSLVTNAAAGMTRRAAQPRGGARGRQAGGRPGWALLLKSIVPRI